MKLPRIPLSPDGQDFAELMALEKIGENTFKSASMPCPGGPRIFDGKLYISTFGGHVYAQAAWAATQTVPDGFVIHNTSGYFAAAGLSNHAFHYTVTHLRTGKSFLTVLVTVTQPTSPLSSASSPSSSCSFTATVSFKRPEPASSSIALDYQDPPLPNDGGPLNPVADLLRHGGDGDTHRPCPHPRTLPIKRFDDLSAVLMYRPPHAFRSASVPGIWWAALPYDESPQHEEQDGKKKEWSSLQDPRPAARLTANLYTVKGSVSGNNRSRRTGGGQHDKDDNEGTDSGHNNSSSSNSKWRHINLSICAHLYASDRETLYLVTRSLGVREPVAAGARSAVVSISHSVVLYDLGDGVVFPDAGDDEVGGERERWFCQEVRTDRWADGRVLVHGRIFDVDTGRHVASTMQDGILKVDFGGEEEAGRAREALRRGVRVEERRTEKAKM